MRIEQAKQFAPKSFSELMTSDNLFLFSMEAASIDFYFHPSSPYLSPSESEEDEEAKTSSNKSKVSKSPLSPNSSLGAILFSSSGSKFLDLLSEAEKEKEELRGENARLRGEVAELKKRLGED